VHIPVFHKETHRPSPLYGAHVHAVVTVVKGAAGKSRRGATARTVERGEVAGQQERVVPVVGASVVILGAVTRRTTTS